MLIKGYDAEQRNRVAALRNGVNSVPVRFLSWETVAAVGSIVGLLEISLSALTTERLILCLFRGGPEETRTPDPAMQMRWFSCVELARTHPAPISKVAVVDLIGIAV